MIDHTSWNSIVRFSDPTYWEANGDMSGHRGGTMPVVAYRHQNGANALHFDGHVSYYTMEEAGVFDDNLAPERITKWFINENYPGPWQ